MMNRAKPAKTAVILFNLGGPDKKESIRPFLFNFFMDKNIIRLPWLFRLFIATLIAVRRSKKEAGESYELLGGGSPLLKNTQAQAAALEKFMNEKNAGAGEYKTFVCMRYWHPMTREIVKAVKEYNPDHVILLPLYPQYSTTTTRSSFEQWARYCRKEKLSAPYSGICCYPWQEGFIQASAENIAFAYNQAYQQAQSQNLPAPRILFSAHGLPEDIIKDGDPYQWQCEQSAAKIIDYITKHKMLQPAQKNAPDWQICYQSRVGPKKWIDPSTEDALIQAGQEGRPVVIYPHAFVSEHVETLVEIEQEYRELAEENQVPLFVRVPTVDTAPAFIEGLATLIAQAEKSLENKTNQIAADGGARCCPRDYQRCCMAQNPFK